MDYKFVEVGCDKKKLDGVKHTAKNEFMMLLLYVKHDRNFISLSCFNEYFAHIIQIRDLIVFINSSNLPQTDKDRLKQFMSIQIVVKLRMLGDIKNELKKIILNAEIAFQEIIPKYIKDIQFVERELKIW